MSKTLGIPITFEMETSDPDDFLTLLWLADHPRFDLRAVVITPGGRDQLQLVRYGLDKCGRDDVLVGVLHGEDWWKTVDGAKARVADFHYKARAYGEPGEIEAYSPPGGLHAEAGPLLLSVACTRDTLHLSGAPPKNLAEAAKYADFELGSWVMQGGFAGDNMVLPEHRLSKFDGHLTRPSFNPGGAPKQTLALLADPRIRKKTLVSKNVCHGVVWDDNLQKAFNDVLEEDDGGEVLVSWAPGKLFATATTARPIIFRAGIRRGLRMVSDGLKEYLRVKGRGKAVHDLVAATCALEPSVCSLTPCEVYREEGEWGARAFEGSTTSISVAVDIPKFVEVLAGDCYSKAEPSY